MVKRRLSHPFLRLSWTFKIFEIQGFITPLMLWNWVGNIETLERLENEFKLVCFPLRAHCMFWRVPLARCPQSLLFPHFFSPSYISHHLAQILEMSLLNCFCSFLLLYSRGCQDPSAVEPRYNEVLGTMKITLLYQVSHYIRVKNKEI